MIAIVQVATMYISYSVDRMILLLRYFSHSHL